MRQIRSLGFSAYEENPKNLSFKESQSPGAHTRHDSFRCVGQTETYPGPGYSKRIASYCGGYFNTEYEFKLHKRQWLSSIAQSGGKSFRCVLTQEVL